MPELPEVETVKNGLAPVMAGRRIIGTFLGRADLRWPLPGRMQQRLEGCNIEAVHRRAKYLLIGLGAETLISHLGMSGRWVIDATKTDDFDCRIASRTPHDHVMLHLDSGAVLRYNDARRFGAMDLAPTTALTEHSWLAGLGPEPLGNSFSASYLMAAFKGRRGPIKTALLNQRIVAGLGNIYVCEALWQAGLDPRRPACTLPLHSSESLTKAIRDTLGRAIDAGGSSLRDYRQSDGQLGYFQHNFSAYGRVGEACLRFDCAGKIIRFAQSGRSTFACESCQMGR